MDRTIRVDRSERSRQTTRPSVLSRLAGRLASAAGLSERISAEQLERRELLFSLTITADNVDPATGIGYASQSFGYVLPHLATNAEPQTQQPTTRAEPFDDENAGAVPSGQFFLDSGIRALHGIAPASDFAIQPGGTDAQDRWLRAAPNNVGEFFAFELWNDSENPAFRIQATQATIEVVPDGPTDNTGLLPANFRATLISNNQVIATFQGAALQALITGANPALGVGEYTFVTPQGTAGFDTVRFEVITAVGGNPAFRIDPVTFTIPAANNVQVIADSIFGATIAISGPVGTQVVVEDLYGTDMRATLGLGVPQGGTLPFVDPDGNGIPNFNVGIGRIRVLNSDARTTVTMWGGEIQSATERPDDAYDFDGQFAFTITDDIQGIYDDFEAAGFGYAFRVQNGNVTVTGLPPGPGSLVIGSPFVRSRAPGASPYTPAAATPVTTGFNEATQGIFVENGSIGSISIHGIVHGASRIAGSADKINIGYLVGSLTVEGDLGSLYVGSDLGQWSPDPDFTPTPGETVDQNNKTGSQVIVGRTAGTIAAAGRGLADITVIGDINNPISRPARDVFTYYEREWIEGITTTVEVRDLIIDHLGANTLLGTRNPTDLFRPFDQYTIFGLSTFRNDSQLTSEWIGSISSGVRIQGELSGQDPLNGEDAADVYGFAVDGTQDIVIEGANGLAATSPYFRIVDQDGRTLAAPELPITSGRFTASVLRWRPTAPGAYYLVVSDPQANDTGVGNSAYTITVTGMATTTLGAYRTGAGSGFTDFGSGEGNSVNVLAGNVGSIRIGTGYAGPDGEEQDPTDTINTVSSADDVMSFIGGTHTVPGSLFNITTGSDIGSANGTAFATVTFRIGGDLGSLYTGQSAAVGRGVNEGDVNFFDLAVGRRIGSIDIRGGIGMDQDETDPRARIGVNSVSVRTGTAGGRGDIGFFRVGFHVGGDALSVNTSPGSVVGAFLVSQDAYTDADGRSGIYLGSEGVPFVTGPGSDVRFVDFPRLDLQASVNILLPIVGDRPLEIVDDSGARVTISVEGAPPEVQVGTVRVLPIDGSQGVAIGQITVDLSGGRILRVQPTQSGGGGGGTGGGLVSIGRIIVTGSDGASNIEITGTTEVDVYRIETIAGGGGGGGGGAAGALNAITNRTPGGDIVSIDVGGLNFIDLAGDLGRTQWPTWGPINYAPWLGLASGSVTAVRGALGVGGENAGGGDGTPLYDFDWNGEIFRPVFDDLFTGGNAYLDDIGSPIDGWLNGAVVRGGSVQEIRVDGGVGDVILAADDGLLTLLNVNADLTTAFGRFDGIFGSIFANDIGRMNLGDGIINVTSGPFATAGIFTRDDIFEIISERAGGVTISAPIIAGNINDPDIIGIEQDGIVTFRIMGGRIENAFIAAQNLDGFWSSFNFGEENLSTGDIQRIDVMNTDFYASTIRARELVEFSTTGYFDASEISATDRIGRVSARGFRNSTLTGEQDEVRQNIILGARDIESLTATEDISDLVIDIIGSVTQSITAVNINRSSIDVDNEIRLLSVTNDLRGSDINTGAVPTITIGRNLQSSTLSVSGRISTLTVGGAIGNAEIEITGPSGSIGSITAALGFTGSLRASGPITTVTVSNGDLAIDLQTTTPLGNVGTLSASRDVALSADISGGLTSIVAGRHIGLRDRPGVILVRGNLQSAAAPNGQLYADIRVSGSILGTITVGGATNKPGQDLVGRGSVIAAGSVAGVTVTGDFGGDIISYSGGIASVSITNGSLLPGRRIAAFDGSIASVIITNGTLFGSVHADYDITSLRVSAGTDGVFGDIGVNPASSSLAFYDSRRNQLPAGLAPSAAVQGPVISAGFNIVNVAVTGGSVFETTFRAGRSIRTITIGGSVANDAFTTGAGNFFMARDSIDAVTVSGDVSNAAFIAGVASLGNDARPGGTGANADIITDGSIVRVAVSGTTSNTSFSAGIAPGVDGLYNTADDRQALGLSSIGALALTNVGANVSAFGDALSSSVANDARLIRGGTNLPSLNPDLDNGAGTPGTAFSGSRSFDYAGASVTIAVSGPGQAFFDTGTGRLTLRNSTSGTNVTVNSSTGSIANFDITTNDDASLGTVTVNATLTGDSDITVDGTLGTLTLGAYAGTGTISIGADAGTLTFASLTGGFVAARGVQTVRINGDFGAASSLVTGEASLRVRSASAITITGAARANIHVERDVPSITVSGVVERSNISVGANLGTFSAPSISRSFVSAGDALTTVAITGDAFATSFSAGLNLGTDSVFGGTGLAADALSTGSIGTVTIGGNFRESSITAGYNRGADGYFGTTDDTIAPGRSAITSVVIRGNQVGSSRFSETYRIASSGTIGTVTIGGSTFSGSAGNFATESLGLPPAPVQVADIVPRVDAGVWYADIIFNQPIDASSLGNSLSIYEVRGTGEILLRLVPGTDYSVSYDAERNAAVVAFSTSVTNANIPQVSGRPGPGIYRFIVDQDLFRARLSNQSIDGNGDGFTLAGEDFSGDAIIGDAGDKFTAGTAFANNNTANRVDFYAPINLDLILDRNDTADGLPDINIPFVIRGSIGDHPDSQNTYFNFGSDVDLFAITLQAGQILRLTGLGGPAELAGLSVFDPSGNPLGLITDNAFATSLPVPQGSAFDVTFPSAYLILVTGTYVIAVGNADTAADTQTIPNNPIPPGGVGDYNFTITIFDDGDTGFNAPTSAGDGAPVVYPPAAIAFAGADRVFGTPDDSAEIVVGAFTFTLDRGTDGAPDTADDLVVGSDNTGITTTRSSDGTITTSVRSAIGPTGHAGVPGEVASDVDIFKLNNAQPIAPGTRMIITVGLTELGADLGSAQPVSGDRGEQRIFVDNRGAVQFGLFDISSAQGIDDGVLVFSPTDFTPTGGTPNTVIADNGSTRYGFNSAGDFYIDFIVPDRADFPGAAGSFAVYLQGVYNTDYTITVVQGGTGQNLTTRQNVFIETDGGQIDWLQVANTLTTIAPFNPGALGFNGAASNGQDVRSYILAQLTSALNSLFDNAPGGGLDVRFSTNPADFEGEQFSTIYLSSTVDPIVPLFDPNVAFNFNFLSQQFFNTQPYGFSEHSDPFNADVEDEGVVFVPSFALLGFTPGQVDMDRFVQSLTGAVARRVGELVGLRIADNNALGTVVFDPFAANSPDLQPGIGRTFTIPNFDRSLSTPFDGVQRSDFFLGQQNARSLLDNVISPG
ncbi:MAG: hypothetical protein SFY69_09740 [Planctomycetota bacterium]|nr:hypothetical protein [Planctomycetota bacterium]